MKSKFLLYTVFLMFLIFSCKKDETQNNQNNTNQIDFSGNWEGTWESSVNSLSGTFTANISQQKNVLAGTISIPALSIENATLKGTANGKNITFGDIGNIITFTGVMNSDSTLSGNYNYESNTDRGTWTTMMPAKVTTLSPSDSILTQLISVSLKGTSFDGSYFYVVDNSNKIYKLSMTGQIVDSLKSPVGYPRGLTFDGANLCLSDEAWGTGMIYRLNGTEKIAISSPGSGEFSGMDIYGNDLWIMDDMVNYNKIYKVSLISGLPVDSISLSTIANSCITFDGQNLWYSSFGNIVKIDTKGNILRQFSYPWSSVSGLAFYQNALWLADSYDQKIYKTDTGLNLISEINYPVPYPGDIAFEGSNLWSVGYRNPPPPAMSIDKAYKISNAGTLSDSINLPGGFMNDGGFAFGNNIFWYASKRTKLIYKVDPSGNGYLRPPVTIELLAHDGTNFWSYNSENNSISEFAPSGNLIKSKSISISSLVGLTWDGNNLWLLSDTHSGPMNLIKLDAECTVIKTVQLSRPTVTIYHSYGIMCYGFVYANNAFWIFGCGPFFDSMKIYKYSL